MKDMQMNTLYKIQDLHCFLKLLGIFTKRTEICFLKYSTVHLATAAAICHPLKTAAVGDYCRQSVPYAGATAAKASICSEFLFFLHKRMSNIN